jgi:hypothetical protein
MKNLNIWQEVFFAVDNLNIWKWKILEIW